MAKSNNSDFIDVTALLKQYLSKWYLFVISVVLCTGFALFYSKIRQPLYAVQANVLISPEKESPAAGVSGAISAVFGSQGDVDDEIFIISSHSLYKNVAKELGTNISHYVKTGFMQTQFAYPDYPVAAVAPQAMLDTLQGSISFKLDLDKKGKGRITAKYRGETVCDDKDITLPYTLTTPVGEFTFTPTAQYPTGKDLKTTISVISYDIAAEILKESVVNEIASKRSNVITMAINTPNPEYGKAVLNEIIKQYNARGVLEKNNQNEMTAKFIDQRLAILTDDLSNTEAQIQKFKQEKGIVDLEIEAKYQTEKKSRLEEELLAAQTQEEIVRMTLAFLKEPRNAYSLIPTTVDNEGIQRNIDIYNEAILQRTDLAASAHPDNVALKQASERIDMLRENITASVMRALSASEVSTRDILREMAESRDNINDLPSQEKEFGNMLRQQTVQQELFIFLLQRREETAMMLANSFPKGIIVDEAYTLSDPLGMKKKMMLILGFLLGLCLPPVYLYLRRLFHNRFESRQEVEKLVDAPVLGEMCLDHSGNNLVVTGNSNTSSAELFRLMRSNLLFVLNDPRDKVVMMTSSKSGEGKTFISINLAASLALLDKKVLLVGMDIRNPRLAQYLDFQPKYGLTQYLSSSSIEVDQLINPVKEVPGLDVITAGPVPPNPAELLISPKVDELFNQLRPRYDYIIVDTAPVGQVSDTFTLDRLSDATIYVCRVNYTPTSDIEFINDIYEQHRLKKLTVIVNGTPTKKSYGYGIK